jgi:hypothetical protein
MKITYQNGPATGESYAPDNISPGSLIACVAAPKLEKLKITAKLGLGNRNFEVVDPF